jgi:hypothetical protein
VSAPEPAPEVEAVLTITLRGAMASVDELAGLTAALDGLLAARYSGYTGVGIKLDAHMKGPMPSPLDQAAAERAARDLGIIP